METDVVEVCPLAFMRGRTLNHAAIILDEAQNCTLGQIKMFLTRMGQGSKVIVTGDPTQTDLPEGSPSGLTHAASLLARTPGVGFVGFDKADVVRHEMVRRIVEAFEVGEGGERTRNLGRKSRKNREETDAQSENFGSDGHEGSMQEKGAPRA
jgi:phosphate starvation-inducible PhoH-like protein